VPVRLLVALLLRALGATLLLSVALVPAADHHAIGRLGVEGGARREDARYLVVHHHPAHGPAAAPGAAGAATMPIYMPTDPPPRAALGTTMLPAVPPVDFVAGGGVPIIVALALGLVPVAAVWALVGGATSRPLSPARRVPVPPPRPALLSVA
jgi:hypothetical protein